MSDLPKHDEGLPPDFHDYVQMWYANYHSMQQMRRWFAECCDIAAQEQDEISDAENHRAEIEDQANRDDDR
jgi:hypothetical protein